MSTPPVLVLYQVIGIEEMTAGPTAKNPGTKFWKLTLVNEDGNEVMKPSLFECPTFPPKTWVKAALEKKGNFWNFMTDFSRGTKKPWLVIVGKIEGKPDVADPSIGTIPGKVATKPLTEDEALLEMLDADPALKPAVDPNESPAAKGHRENLEMWTTMTNTQKDLIKTMQILIKVLQEWKK